MVVEILSPATAEYDRGYKQLLYGRHGVRGYWIVDPDAEAVEVLTEADGGLIRQAAYSRDQTLTSPLLDSLFIELEQVFGQE